MPPVVSRMERILMYILIGSVDLIQIILGFFVVTEVANHIIDIGVGALLLIYAIKRKLLTTHKAMVIAAVFVGEQIPFVNALPFWTYDLYNLYKGTSTEASGGENADPNATSGALNQEGIRRSGSARPLNSLGVRMPSKKGDIGE